MKQISTGTGLVVLSGTVLASVFLSSPRTATTAFASAQQAQLAERSVGRKADSATPVAMLSSCELTPENWFNPIPNKVDFCLDFEGQRIWTSGLGINMADVDGNGDTEFFNLKNTGIQVIQEGQVLGGVDMIWQNFLVRTSEGISVTQKVIWNTGNLGSSLKSMFPDVLNVLVYIGGWRDCDGDGDLDLVCNLYIGDQNDPETVYLENTGFQNAAPLEGDLNHDGHVDSADLGKLLGGYTG